MRHKNRKDEIVFSYINMFRNHHLYYLHHLSSEYCLQTGLLAIPLASLWQIIKKVTRKFIPDRSQITSLLYLKPPLLSISLPVKAKVSPSPAWSSSFPLLWSCFLPLSLAHCVLVACLASLKVSQHPPALRPWQRLFVWLG